MAAIFSSAISGYVSYTFIKLLSTPFEKWDAYKEGIINKKGDTVKNHSSSANWNRFTILVRNIKQILEKTPLVNKSSLFKFASALWLLKEETDTDLSLPFLEYLDIPNEGFEPVNEQLESGLYYHNKKIIKLEEDDIVGTIFGYNIYKFKDVLSEQYSQASIYDLRIL